MLEKNCHHKCSYCIRWKDLENSAHRMDCTCIRCTELYTHENHIRKHNHKFDSGIDFGCTHMTIQDNEKKERRPVISNF